MSETPTPSPEHRSGPVSRSGDDHVIGADGTLRKADLADLAASVRGDDGAPLNPPAGKISNPPASIARPAPQRAK